MSKLRIGTRSSKLAVFQAETVQSTLLANGIDSELKYIKSEGDLDQTTPLDQFSGPGVFTKALDIALLNGEIDIAVHSLKDYPVIDTDAKIALIPVLKRADPIDVLVMRKPIEELNKNTHYLIATSSSRRKAQWLYRFPNSEIVDLRGNVPRRLEQVESGDWTGAIFAKAGLDRLNIYPKNMLALEWMIPAPSQGAIGVTCLTSNSELNKEINNLVDYTDSICVKLERDFMGHLGGGCESPIGAYAKMNNGILSFKGEWFSADFKERQVMDITCNLDGTSDYALKFAELMKSKINSSL